MFKVTANTELNRLYISISGHIEMGEAKNIVQAVGRESKLLKTGFDVINDLSNYKFGNPSAGRLLQGAIKYLQARGVNRVIRVVGKSKIALIQFARFTQIFSNYKTIYVPTMEEAEKKLAPEYID